MAEKVISVALVGNPNVGKSALFNALTGSAQLIGNWCGKTTEACTTRVAYAGREIDFTDLPGIYGFGHTSRDETLVDIFLRAEKPDLLMVVIDALSLERNLYLLLEVLERYGRAVAVLNKTDAAGEHGIVIDYDRLAALLGIPVLPAVATGQLAAAVLYETLFTVADGAVSVSPHEVVYPERVEKALATAPPAGDDRAGSARWRAVEALEDADEELQVDIINTRYAAAARIAAACAVHHPTESVTDKIDRWALHRYWGVPIMAAVFAVLFFLTFSVSRPLSSLIGDLFGLLQELARTHLPAAGVPDYLISLLCDGLLNGVGATLGFLPQIALFFFVYHIIQDSGYIVRVAFLMDRVMSAIGLNGKIFIPLVAGYSCNVSGILASRILTSRYDRLVAVLASSYAPCSARIGVMVFMVSAFFPSHTATLVMLGLLSISVAMMAVVAFAVKLFAAADDEVSPFMTEVPVYHLPDWKHLLYDTGARTLHFLHRIRNVIVISSVATWYLSSYPSGAFETTYLARIGQFLEPFGAALGLDWQLLVALIAGIPAKESALTTLGVIYQTGDGSLAHVLAGHISPLAAFTFLVVYMTYIPCLATVVTIYQEMRSWSVAIFSVYGSVVLSIALGVLSYNIGRFFF